MLIYSPVDRTEPQNIRPHFSRIRGFEVHLFKKRLLSYRPRLRSSRHGSNRMARIQKRFTQKRLRMRSWPRTLLLPRTPRVPRRKRRASHSSPRYLPDRQMAETETHLHLRSFPDRRRLIQLHLQATPKDQKHRNPASHLLDRPVAQPPPPYPRLAGGLALSSSPAQALNQLSPFPQYGRRRIQHLDRRRNRCIPLPQRTASH